MVKTNKKERNISRLCKDELAGIIAFIVLSIICIFAITMKVFADDIEKISSNVEITAVTSTSREAIEPTTVTTIITTTTEVTSSSATKKCTTIKKTTEETTTITEEETCCETEACIDSCEEETYDDNYEVYDDTDDYYYEEESEEVEDDTYTDNSGTTGSNRYVSDYEYNMLVNLTSSEYGSSWIDTYEKSKITATILNIADLYYGGSIVDAIYVSCVPYGFDPSYDYYKDDSIYAAVNNVIYDEASWSNWTATSWYGDGTYNYFS